MNEKNTFRLAKGCSYTHFKFVICHSTKTAKVYKLFGSESEEYSLSDQTVISDADVGKNLSDPTFTIKHDVDVPVEQAREFWKILTKHYGYHPNNQPRVV